MNSSTRALEVLSADDKKLQNCNIVYGVHPHTIYLIIAVFAAAAIASFFIGFCVSRCCVSLKRRRRKKLFSSGGEGPSLSSPSFRRSVTRSSQRDRSNHRHASHLHSSILEQKCWKSVKKSKVSMFDFPRNKNFKLSTSWNSCVFQLKLGCEPL